VSLLESILMLLLSLLQFNPLSFLLLLLLFDNDDKIEGEQPITIDASYRLAFSVLFRSKSFQINCIERVREAQPLV
jgi:hypothetical protein